MKRITRFSIAVLLVGILALTATGVWASQKFKGTVPAVPQGGSGQCPDTVDMGTALFTPQHDNCTISVERMARDANQAFAGGPSYSPLPESLVYVGDAFKVTIDPPTTLVKICYAYPPELAEKDAKIYKLNEEANPALWVEAQNAEIKDGVICVTTTPGYFALIGKP